MQLVINAYKQYVVVVESFVVVVVSAHYISRGGFAVTALERPSMYYDYGGFPQEAYELQYPAPVNIF